MNTLVIWEEVPETTKLYVIPNNLLTEERLELLQQCAGTFVNTDSEKEATIWLMETLTEEREYCTNESVPESEKCIFAQYKIDAKEVIIADISRVVLSGFML